MKIKELQTLGIILSFCGLALSAPTCDYKIIEDKYVCIMSNSASEDEIIGNHTKTDSDVYRVTTNDEATKSLIGKVLALYQNLKIFQIPNGNIQTIEEADFENCPALVELQICNGDLSVIPDKVFDKCSNLVSIDLAGNKITKVLKLSFRTTVTKLILSNNPINIDKIQSTLFNAKDNLDALTHLDLSGCSIEKLTDSVLPSEKLIHLDLSNNKLNELPESYFNDIVDLEVLNLQGNQLTSISQTIFNKLTKLKELRIGSNKVGTIHASIFNENKIMEFLDMSSNPIVVLDANLLKSQTALKALNLHDTNLTTSSLEPLKTTLMALVNLDKLNISKNNLGPIDDLFTKNEKLTELSIANMSLTEFKGDIFSALTKLQSLNFDDNEIVELPENIFEKLTEIKIFSAKGNKIVKLKASTFEKMTNLESIDFRGNEINAIESTFFDKLTNLKVVRFSDGNKCFDNDLEDFELNIDMRVKFKKCFDNYNSARNVMISNVLLALVVIFKFV